MAGGSGGPPKLDRRNYAYWKAHMAGYLEAINPIAWVVTKKPIVSPWNEDQVKYGNHLKLSMLVLKSFVKKNIKCLRKNLMNSKCLQMSWLNKCLLD